MKFFGTLSRPTKFLLPTTALCRGSLAKFSLPVLSVVFFTKLDVGTLLIFASLSGLCTTARRNVFVLLTDLTNVLFVVTRANERVLDTERDDEDEKDDP